MVNLHCRSTVARLVADLGPLSKCPESSVKGLPARELVMYLIEQQGGDIDIAAELQCHWLLWGPVSPDLHTPFNFWDAVPGQ